ncbi:superoxide dismutase family protein [Pontibacillus litoralis]|uniref:Superoxide dismutase [Cu-Zn] n=1 Tax=Pontibacillus litoralis JSM 072002 TaxID=1385512 RepID=A0A0A5HSV4_9BACI|nr:superoxide dismutase family protein [Pontibacillus litoralis]KGX86727.1 Cu-Zn superoxide dismutase [Pontibacillus litoralis JSM 072002]
MSKWFGVMTVCVGLFLSGCDMNRSVLKIDMYNSEGDSLGTATLTEGADAVDVKLSLTGLEPGLHGIHVHEFPKCEGPDFKSAGSHLNPDGKNHGLLNPDGSHLGDLPNIEADSSGAVEADVTISGATLKDGKTSLLRDNGTSLIIHQGQDDGVSQPAGNAGERIACGKIQVDEAQKQDAPSDPTEDGEQKMKE